MGKQLIAARNDLESRFNDMDLMIRILELDENKKIENQLLLKSSLLLMVYNAIEALFLYLLFRLTNGSLFSGFIRWLCAAFSRFCILVIISKKSSQSSAKPRSL